MTPVETASLGVPGRRGERSAGCSLHPGAGQSGKQLHHCDRPAGGAHTATPTPVLAAEDPPQAARVSIRVRGPMPTPPVDLIQTGTWVSDAGIGVREDTQEPRVTWRAAIRKGITARVASRETLTGIVRFAPLSGDAGRSRCVPPAGHTGSARRVHRTDGAAAVESANPNDRRSDPTTAVSVGVDAPHDLHDLAPATDDDNSPRAGTDPRGTPSTTPTGSALQVLTNSATSSSAVTWA